VHRPKTPRTKRKTNWIWTRILKNPYTFAGIKERGRETFDLQEDYFLFLYLADQTIYRTLQLLIKDDFCKDLFLRLNSKSLK
jgi:hypothetical protein